VIAQFTSGLAAQASASRLMYAMGRDGVLPRRVFGVISERFASPVPAIVTAGVVGLLATVLDVATSTSFINFGAFLAFTMVNASVIVYFLRQRADGVSLNPFSYVVVPSVGAVVTVYLLFQLDEHAVRLGLGWLTLGIVVLAVLTKGFRGPPPEMAIDESTESAVPAA
jgi:putrescine importer